jgi:hypothetical protein
MFAGIPYPIEHGSYLHVKTVAKDDGPLGIAGLAYAGRMFPGTAIQGWRLPLQGIHPRSSVLVAAIAFCDILR